MIIGIQNGLDEIISDLETKGYTVKVMNELTELVDVYIYNSGKVNGLLSKNQISYQSNQVDDSYEIKGTFMINAKGKSVDELEHMVKYKCYSSLGLF